MEKFNQILFNVPKFNKECYIMGDYNIDMFHLNEHSPAQEFVDSLFTHMFYPLNNRPTRITAHSATLIDNILTNNLSSQLFGGIILKDLSDHLPVFVYTFTESSPVHANRNQYTIARDYSENNIAIFRTHLTNVDWSNYSDNDPSIMYNNCLNEFLRIYDLVLSFPAMVVKRKKYKPQMPWMTKALLSIY